MERFKEDMLTKYGVDLETELTEITPEAFFTRTRDLIELAIQDKNPTYLYQDRYEPFIYKATLEQAYYTINNTDFTIITGINFQTGTIMPIEEIRKRDLSPNSYRILANAGLFYSGLDRHSTNDYRFKRGF